MQSVRFDVLTTVLLKMPDFEMRRCFVGPAVCGVSNSRNAFIFRVKRSKYNPKEEDSSVPQIFGNCSSNFSTSRSEILEYSH